MTLFDNLVAVTPDEDRTNYIAISNLFTYVALFLGPLVGGALGGQARG